MHHGHTQGPTPGVNQYMRQNAALRQEVLYLRLPWWRKFGLWVRKLF